MICRMKGKVSNMIVKHYDFFVKRMYKNDNKVMNSFGPIFIQYFTKKKKNEIRLKGDL